METEAATSRRSFFFMETEAASRQGVTSSPLFPLGWSSVTEEVSDQEYYYPAEGDVQWDHPAAPTKKTRNNKYARTETL